MESISAIAEGAAAPVAERESVDAARNRLARDIAALVLSAHRRKMAENAPSDAGAKGNPPQNPALSSA